VAAHILTWLGAAYGLMYRQQLFSSLISLWGARILIGASLAAIVFVSLGSLNPIVTEDPVPGNVVFNALLLAYLAPVVLLGFILRRLEALGWLQFRPAVGILALVLAMTYVTLETKRVFQGHALVAWSLSGAESYAYSAVWLVSALALFAAGTTAANTSATPAWRHGSGGPESLPLGYVGAGRALPDRLLPWPGPQSCGHRLALSAICAKTEGGMKPQGRKT
jgi:uncharacterized membrane protein